jgi:hypothetical protein
MLCAVPEGSPCERRGRLAIDPVIQVVDGEFVSDSGQVDDYIALFEQGLPVERNGKVRERDGDDVRIFESGRRPGCRDHPVALRGEIGHQMPSNETIRARHQHGGSIIHLN